MKGHPEKLERVSKITEQVLASRTRQIVHGPSAAVISDVQAVLQTATKSMQELASRAQQPDAPADTAMEDPPMNPEQIAQTAELAASAAVKAAKAAGVTDAAKLAAAGSDARMSVFKAAVAGPPQPGIPTNALKTQMDQSQGLDGAVKDPEGSFMKAINRLTKLTSKLDKLEEILIGKGEGDAREPGLVDVVAKQSEALASVGQRVQKMAGIPTPPRGGGDGEETTPTQEVTKKSDDNVFSGTALSFI